MQKVFFINLVFLLVKLIFFFCTIHVKMLCSKHALKGTGMVIDLGSVWQMQKPVLSFLPS